MSNMVDTIRQFRVVPVAALDSVDDGLRMCEALLAADLKAIEITFRTAAAEDAIRAVAKRFDDMLVGAGTILNVTDMKRAQDAGAKFAVSPGLNPTVVQAAIEAGLAFSPGVATPSDVEKALEMGLKLLKFFPAQELGGAKLVKSTGAPYAHLGVQFIPTGGISAANMMDYLALPQVAAVGGSWMVAKDLVRAGNWAEVTALAAEAVKLARSAG